MRGVAPGMAHGGGNYKVTPASVLAPGVAPRPGPGVGRAKLTAEQWAQRQANLMVQAQIKAINDQKAAYLNELNNVQNSQIERGRQLAQSLRDMNYSGAILTPFGQMAASDRAYASGFGNAVASGANAAAADATNMLGGDSSNVRNEGGAMGSVMNTEFGLTPANVLTATGNAYAQDAANQPGIAAASAYQGAMLGYKPDLAQFDTKIAELLANKPQTMMDLLKQRYALINARTSTRLAAQKEARYRQQAAFQQKMDIIKFKADQEYRQAEIYASQGRLALAQQHLLLAQQHERAYEAAAAAGAAGGGGRKSTSSTVPGTPAFNAKMLQKIGGAQDKMMKDATLYLKGIVPKNLTDAPSPDYQRKVANARNRLLRKYGYLATTPAAKKMLRQTVDAVVQDAIQYILDSGGKSGSTGPGLNTFFVPQPGQGQ